MKKLSLVLYASIITFTSLNSLAQSEAMSVHALDTDKDGLLSASEAKADATLSAIFTELDINQDGFLSRQELDVEKIDETK
jgi:hypothetical protein